MPSITGTYYDGQSSRPYPTSLEVNEEGFARLAGVDRDLVYFGELDVPSRVGNTPRCVGWPGGGVFETTDHATLDGWVTRFGTRGRDHILHKLERNLWVILPLLAVTALVVYLMVTRAIPWGAEVVAHQLSAEWSEELGESVLDRLDEYYLNPTTTSKSERQRYEQLLNEYVPADSDFTYTLHFRDGGLIGPNAFALPNGSLILTDQLIELADSEEEVLSVLLHEIGHVEHRHSLRGLLESTGVAVMFTLMTGDAEFVQEFVVAIPPLLLQAQFSRDHEWEADGYALERMQEAGLDPGAFASIMAKLANVAEEQDGDVSDETAPDDLEVAKDDEATEKDHLLDYLSTHPPSEARIQRFREASQP